MRSYPPEIVRPALQKLDMLDSARDLSDLARLPGTGLELLRSDLEGFDCIRVNERWRVVFRWEASEAHEVRIVDYHRG